MPVTAIDWIHVKSQQLLFSEAVSMLDPIFSEHRLCWQSGFNLKIRKNLIHKENMLPLWQPKAFSSLCNKSLPFHSFLLCLYSVLNWMPNMSSSSYQEGRGRFPETMTQASCVIPLSFLCLRKRKGQLSKDRQFGRLTQQQIPAPQAEPWAYIVKARQPHKSPLKPAYI